MNRLILLVLASGCATSDAPLFDDDDDDARLVDVTIVCDVRVPRDYATVQEGIDATPDQGTLCLGQGTFLGTIDVTQRILSVVGRGPLTVLDGDGAGSTVTVDESNVDLVRLTITGGLAATNGGGIHATGGSNIHVFDSTLTANEAGQQGGAIWAEAQAYVWLDDVRLTRNHAFSGGGAIAFDHGDFISVDHVRIVGNTVQDGPGGAVHGKYGSIHVYHSTILDNDAGGPAGDGGAVSLTGSYGGFGNTIIAGNVSGARGGGFALVGSTDGRLSVENSVVAGNHATSGGGAIMVSGAKVTTELFNSAIVGNRSTTGAGGVKFAQQAGAAFNNCDLWDNTRADVAGHANPVGRNGNIAVDPMFIHFTGRNPRGWDLHLAAGSPLIDAGYSGFADPDGTPGDIGVYGGPHAE